MLLAEAGCVFMTFFLLISGVQGQENRICALKGSSVDLPCSAEHPTSNMKWYTVHLNASAHVREELSADGKQMKYNITEKSYFTLTIKDVRESDENTYCCGDNADTAGQCWIYRTELHVADLQVKVIPTTEGQTVSLMCSTSCPLTENPAAYIWYKNGEFLYEDWSPWYQELVSSEEAVRYSCAVKGYEDLRAPDVSVDSVTSTCFSVTYGKGKMCSYVQKSEDEPCTITYPREVHVQKTGLTDSVRMTCNSSCPLTDPRTAYRWYWDRQFFSSCENQAVTLLSVDPLIYSCAVKGHEDLRSEEGCTEDDECWSVNYVSRRICALEGSQVNISSIYANNFYTKIWNIVKRRDVEGAEVLTEDDGRLEYHDNMAKQHILRINNLKKNDSAEYVFRLHRGRLTQSDLPGVTLVVSGLTVMFTPSSVVTEGQRVTLTCSTSCPLTDNTNYIWYLNSRPLTQPENQHKHLVLDPVSSQHAGNYSCAVTAQDTTSSPEKTLTVKSPGKSVVILNAVKLTVLILLLPSGFLLYLMMRRNKTLTPAVELSDKVLTEQTDLLHDSITLVAMNPEAQAGPAEQQEDTV